MPETSPTDARLPRGTVTFLFTDIEGSTQLWETQRAAMQQALAHHDAIIREAIAANAGYLVKTTGDGVHAVFAVAADAIAACLRRAAGVAGARLGRREHQVTDGPAQRRGRRARRRLLSAPP